MQTHFNNAFRSLELKRFPLDKNQTLQAWDAADEYLLNYLSEQQKSLDNKSLLIFNDSFGALTSALANYSPSAMTDSYISELATLYNLAANDINTKNIVLLNSLSKHNKHYDYVLIKLPKTLDYLSYFLSNLAHFVHPNTKFIVAGMVKNTPKTVWTILEKYIGPTTTSLAKKKARLIFSTYTNKKESTPFPTYFIQENSALKIYNHANVFSKQSLDIGTRFLLKKLPKLARINSIIDLGCGNGIVGLNLALIYPEAHITFTDESYMAIESARLTIQNNINHSENYKFLINNCLDGFKVNSVDLIVCNPPFHQSHTIGMHIALQMFRQSQKTLLKGGTFIVIANRHLPYQNHLKKLFNSFKVLASNQKFSIYSMIK